MATAGQIAQVPHRSARRVLPMKRPQDHVSRYVRLHREALRKGFILIQDQDGSWSLQSTRSGETADGGPTLDEIASFLMTQEMS
jgi:hypothetical protein